MTRFRLTLFALLVVATCPRPGFTQAGGLYVDFVVLQQGVTEYEAWFLSENGDVWSNIAGCSGEPTFCTTIPSSDRFVALDVRPGADGARLVIALTENGEIWAVPDQEPPISCEFWMQCNPLPAGVASPAAVAPKPERYLRVAPNPFNPSTRLEFVLEADGTAEVRVYDARGRSVRELRAGNLPAGEHTVRWDGKNALGRMVASGSYYFDLLVDGDITARSKAMLVK